jgi:hypothetical protein
MKSTPHSAGASLMEIDSSASHNAQSAPNTTSQKKVFPTDPASYELELPIGM